VTTKARGKLPPVPVTCTRPECGHQWTSPAKRHTSLACPACGRHVRVKRDPVPVSQATPRRADGPVCAVIPQAVPSALSPRTLVPALAPAGDQDDDEGRYMPDATGRLVLADLTPDLRLIPVTLVDQRFRLAAPGQCSVYGCLGPARYDHDGWPVCPACRFDLSAPDSA
jgi:hypothetical protein